jgi:predicted component of type VI protein secretion system
VSISQQMFYHWKPHYVGLELCQLKQLLEPNEQLKQLVTKLMLDKRMFQEVLRKM